MGNLPELQLKPETLQRHGLPDIAYPVPVAKLASALGSDGELPFGVMLHGLQQRAGVGGDLDILTSGDGSNSAKLWLGAPPSVQPLLRLTTTSIGDADWGGPSDGQFQLCTHPPSSLVICRSGDFSRFHVLANGVIRAVS